MNPFINLRPSLAQIESTPSSQDGISKELESVLRSQGTRLIQACGILLKLPQSTIATAMTLFQQFYYVASFRQHALKDTLTASLFLASKLLETPSNPQNIINVLLTLQNQPLPGLFTQSAQEHQDALFASEMHILKNLGFQVEVKLPYSLAINYLQILGLSDEDEVSQRVWNYCNDLLRTELTCIHTPPTLACTAIFLTIRDIQLKLPAGWMDIFDVELADIVHASAHLKVFYHEEGKRAGMQVLLTLTELEDYLRRKRDEDLQ